MDKDAALLRTLPQAERVLALVIGDVGCGFGERCRLWAGRGHQVHGIDRDPERIALARRLAADADPPVSFDVARAQALPWPGCSMDLCLVQGALVNAPGWGICLGELVRVLRPGGALFLVGASWTGLVDQLAPYGLNSPPGSPLAFKTFATN